MFWRVAGLATASPVDAILDREQYTLEELLDEDDLIQECKSLNNRLITFLRTKEQVLKMVQYVVEPPPEGSDDKRNYKFPFISCEVFTCEIDQILNTVVEEQEILDILFSFPQPDRPHSNLLSGYFSKVVNSLLLRKTPEMMTYLQAHQEILKQLVDLVGTTSVMEVIMRLVGAHDEILMYHSEKLAWLADTPLLDLLVDQLGPEKLSDVQVNTAEVLSSIARTSPAALALKLATPAYVHKLFHHVLEEPQSMTSVINSLSVCITLLGPRRLGPGPGSMGGMGFRPGQPPQQQPPLGQEGSHLDAAMAETIGGMLERLGAILELLDTTKDEKVLVTTYGQLKPPLGIHRLKVVEFLGVLVASQSEQVFKELIRLGGIKICLDLFFQYHFNNFLHHHVERMMLMILESGNQEMLEHLTNQGDCDLLNRILVAYDAPHAPDTRPEPRAEVIRGPTRSGYMGHLTRIANRIVQLCNSNPAVDAVVAKNTNWVEWSRAGLKSRNAVENVYKWACGRPASLDDRPQDSDDDDFNRNDRDFDLGTISLTGGVQRQYNQPRYGQPILDIDDEEAQEPSTASQFDTQMENAEQGMTELRIDDSAPSTSEIVEDGGPTRSSDSQEGSAADEAAAAGLISLRGDSPDNPEQSTTSAETLDASQGLFASSDAARTAWIAFQDDMQQQQQPQEQQQAPEIGEISVERPPAPEGGAAGGEEESSLSTPYAGTPRPVSSTPVDSFSQTPFTSAQNPIAAAADAAAAAAASGPEEVMAVAEIATAAAASDATVSADTAVPLETAESAPAPAPVVDLFANAPPEFRMPPQLIAEGGVNVEPTGVAVDSGEKPAGGEADKGPVAMETESITTEAVAEAVPPQQSQAEEATQEGVAATESGSGSDGAASSPTNETTSPSPGPSDGETAGVSGSVEGTSDSQQEKPAESAEKEADAGTAAAAEAAPTPVASE